MSKETKEIEAKINILEKKRVSALLNSNPELRDKYQKMIDKLKKKLHQ